MPDTGSESGTGLIRHPLGLFLYGPRVKPGVTS